LENIEPPRLGTGFANLPFAMHRSELRARARVDLSVRRRLL
jgi:hypothetical protein